MSERVGKDPAVEPLRRILNELQSGYDGESHGLKERLEQILGQFPRFPGHFLYVYNFSTGRIAHAQGFQEVLGYRDDEVDIELLLDTYHPDDASMVARLSRSAIEAMARMRNPQNLHELAFTLDYRMRKADGRYVKILRQTAVFEVDARDGAVRSVFSLCKDISTIKEQNTIGWKADGFELVELEPPPDPEHRLQYRPSPREMEVVRKIAAGKSSKEVAQELGITLHTANTHRRNLLQRTGLRNTAELVRRMGELGWL